MGATLCIGQATLLAMDPIATEPSICRIDIRTTSFARISERRMYLCICDSSQKPKVGFRERLSDLSGVEVTSPVVPLRKRRLEELHHNLTFHRLFCDFQLLLDCSQDISSAMEMNPEISVLQSTMLSRLNRA